jgi:hypothetical protein
MARALQGHVAFVQAEAPGSMIMGMVKIVEADEPTLALEHVAGDMM